MKHNEVAKTEDLANATGMVDAFANLSIEPRQLLVELANQTELALTLSDPHASDNPLVYCNPAFEKLTGYSRSEVIGRNCRFLQGENSAKSAIGDLSTALKSRKYSLVELVNYRKDGSPFWCAVHVGPVYHADGRLAYFFGSQRDVTELRNAQAAAVETQAVADELRHRTANLFSVLNAIVRLTVRDASNVEDYAVRVQNRIGALATAHQFSLGGQLDSKAKPYLGDLVETVMQPYRNQHPKRLAFSGPSIQLPERHVTPLGLTFHELATNAIKYGALAQPDGKIRIGWEAKGDRLRVTWEGILGTTRNRTSRKYRGAGPAAVL